MFSIIKRALSWAISSFGNKFCLKTRSRLIKALDNRFYIKFMQLEIGLLFTRKFAPGEPKCLNGVVVEDWNGLTTREIAPIGAISRLCPKYYGGYSILRKLSPMKNTSEMVETLHGFSRKICFIFIPKFATPVFLVLTLGIFGIIRQIP